MSDGEGTAPEAGLATSWASASPSARTLLLPLAARTGKESLVASRIVREVRATRMTMVQLAGSLQ